MLGDNRKLGNDRPGGVCMTGSAGPGRGTEGYSERNGWETFVKRRFMGFSGGLEAEDT